MPLPIRCLQPALVSLREGRLYNCRPGEQSFEWRTEQARCGVESMKAWDLLGTKLLIFFLIMLTSALAQTLPREIREQIIRATVLIEAGDARGSGTIISPQGYILTNYHVVGDIENRTIAPQIRVGVVRFVDQPPRLDYLAEVVEGDPNLDLAIIRITRTANGQPIGNVTFPAVPIGDSNKLIVGDPIYVFGFQGTGGLTISFSSGVVGGFTGEDGISGGKQWIKHDAQTGPGNSGGGVYNQNGELIGIHTAGVGGGGNSRTAFMRPSALAWGLVSPNVQGLVRPGTPASNPSVQQPSPTPQPAGSSRPRVVSTGQLLRVEVRGGGYTADWIVQVGEQDKDGDFKAVATQGSRRIDVLVVFDSKNNVAIGTFSGNNLLPHFCRVTPTNNGFTDGQLYEIKDNNPNRVGTCNVTLATAPAELSWPPSIATGETFQVNMQVRGYSGSWNVRIGNKDKDGDYLMAISEGGREAEGIVIIYPDRLVMGLFYVNQTGYICLLREQKATGVYRGTASEMRDNNFVDAGTCTVAPSSVGSSRTAAPAPATISWPPQFATGQVWQITSQGLYTGTWNIQVGQRDNRGNYEATATQGSRQKVIAIAITQEGFGMGFLSFDEPNPYFCLFRPQSPAAALEGKLVQSRNGTNVEIGSCRLTLIQGR